MLVQTQDLRLLDYLPKFEAVVLTQPQDNGDGKVRFDLRDGSGRRSVLWLPGVDVEVRRS